MVVVSSLNCPPFFKTGFLKHAVDSVLFSKEFFGRSGTWGGYSTSVAAAAANKGKFFQGKYGAHGSQALAKKKDKPAADFVGDSAWRGAAILDGRWAFATVRTQTQRTHANG